jgi:hypothetical protein
MILDIPILLQHIDNLTNILKKTALDNWQYP